MNVENRYEQVRLQQEMLQDASARQSMESKQRQLDRVQKLQADIETLHTLLAKK